MPVDRDYIRETLVRLVRIDSVNPSLAEHGGGEAAIAEFVAGSLRSCGLAVECFEPEPRRVTVLGTLAGSGGGRSLMLNAHTDTVDTVGMAEPFSGVVREGKVFGRGTYDMKGSLAACMGAAKALRDSGVRLRGDLLVAAVADEEYGSLGTRDLLRALAAGERVPQGAIVTEPTGLNVCLAHKGYLWIEVKVAGRAAHGSKFASGIDANIKMGQFLYRLADLERDLRSRAPHPLVGPPSLHAALLAGGTGLSTYAAEATVQIERRTIPGESEAKAVAEIQAIVDGLAAEDPDFRATVECYFSREPFEASREAPIATAAHAAVLSVTGTAPAFIGETPWMDSALLQAAGVETVVVGPSGEGAHSAGEWVDLESVMQLAEILAETARGYCA